MYDIHDPVTAYCFDRAVTAFGQAVEDDIREGTRKLKTEEQAKRKANLILHKWMSDPAPEVKPGAEVQRRTKFRDPAERFKKVSNG